MCPARLPCSANQCDVVTVWNLPLTRGLQRQVVRAWGEGVPSEIFDAQYWLDRAEEARLQAEEMTQPAAKREMLLIAAGYRRLAQHAEERTARKFTLRR
jgi:hypothetical protein